MATNDFYQDAEDALNADPEGSHILIYAQPGQQFARFDLHVPSPDHMRWLVEKFKGIIRHWEKANNYPPEDYFDDPGAGFN